MDFGRRLAQLREEKNVNQKIIADLIKVQSSAISKYEKGITQPNAQTLMILAEFFEVSVDYLLGYSSIPNPYAIKDITPREADVLLRYRMLSDENLIRIDERLDAMLEEQARKGEV